MIGEIAHNLSSGGGTIRMEEYGKNTVCEGTAKSVGIYDGTLELTCTDGRTATGKWEATTLKSGFGTAKDSKGVTYDLVFGLSDTEVQNYIDEFVGDKNGR